MFTCFPDPSAKFRARSKKGARGPLSQNTTHKTVEFLIEFLIEFLCAGVASQL